jgi:DNA-binding beta-propeller fold protein YncE
MCRHISALMRACCLLCCHGLLCVAVSLLLLSPAAPALAVGPTGALYVANYNSGRASVFRIEANGQLSPLGSVQAGRGPISITVHPSGQFAYVTNNQSLDITQYRIDATGMLVLQGTEWVGWEPVRSMAIHASGRSAYVP